MVKEHEFFVLGTLEEFVSVPLLRAKISKLEIPNLNDDERKLVALFMKALDRRDAGKPDYTALSWRFDDAVLN